MSAPGPILTVCTANICRSPMAAALLQHALGREPEPLRSVPVVSAGVVARPGEPVTGHSITALKKVGIDIASSTSQPLTQELVQRASVIFCMTESHRAMIHLNFDPIPRHVYLFREFLPPPADREIRDPYGANLRAYETARDEMVEAIPSILKFLREHFASG